MKIKGSKILITGASGGIGGAISAQLAQLGASLILVDRDGGKLATFADELKRAGASVITLSGDPAVPPASCRKRSARQAASIS